MLLQFLRLLPTVSVRNACSSSINCFTLRTHNCGELRLEHVGQRVKVYGWLTTKRMDKFLLIKDAYGSVQALLPEEMKNLIKSLKEQSSLFVEGTVTDRGKDRNNKIPTGHIQINAEKIEVFNSIPSGLPVFDSSNELTRLTYRYLDLRTDKMQHALRFRAQIISKMRRFLEDQCSFVDIQTPTLSHFTPGGANEFPVPANDKGECFSLPQSPQIYKQLLMCGGIDKYYQVAICYRDELTKPNRQPEFTQLDLELSFTNQEKIISLIEQIIINSWPEELEQYKPAVPFPRMDYSKAMTKYGTDKPDMRIPWEITDCLLEDIENSSKIVAKMFVAKGALKSLIKERILRWKQKIGLLPYKQEYSIIRPSSINKFSKIPINKDYLLNLNLDKDNDVIVVCWGDCEESVLKVIGYLRNYLAEAIFNYFEPNLFNFVWITRFPLFSKDEESGEIQSAHHPFTAPLSEHEEDLKNGINLDKIEAQHYDLVLNGEEIGGGSIRIHNAELQKYVLTKILGIDHEPLNHLLEALQYGAPPHGGFALGLDRYVAILNAKGDSNASIRDVIAFPKSASGKCHMTGSPTKPDESLLDRYNLEIPDADEVERRNYF
ncbi:hypothetical protein ACQ4LE_006922 [Meloidogyne hapla]